MQRILFVCLGNICRSPTAEAVFRAKAAEAGLALKIESAGTGAWHVGEPPDKRMRAAAARRGYDLEPLRARQVSLGDFYEFDLVVAMDRSNEADLRDMAPADGAEVRLMLSFAEGVREIDVPDPYYGGREGFEHVIDLVERASDGLLRHISPPTSGNDASTS